MKWLKFAFKNVFRNRRRSVVTILIAAVGTTGVLIAAGYGLSTYRGLALMSASESGNVMLAHHDYYDKEEETSMQYGLADYERLRRDVQADPRVRAVLARIQFSGLVTNGDKSTIYLGSGLEPGEFTVKNQMTFALNAGQVLSANPDPHADAEVMIGKGLARSMGAGIGSTLTLLATTSDGALNAVDVRVRGIFSVGVEEADKRLIYANVTTAQELLRTNKVSTLSVYLNDINQTTPVLTGLAARYPQYAFRPWWELAPYYVAVKALFNRLFGVLGVVLVVLVFFSVSNTMTMSVVERTRETGTLAALGAYPRELIRNFVLEAALIGLLGAVIGMALAGSVSFLVEALNVQMPPPPGRSDGYPLRIDVSLMLDLLTGVLVLVTCTVAAFLSARRGVKKPIVEALAHV